MPVDLLLKLCAIFAVVAAGYAAGRRGWVGAADAGRTLSMVAFTLFIPPLLFRTTARIDLATLPWSTLAVFFVPVMLLMLGTYAWQRQRGARPVAAPAVRAITAGFGNTVQLGIPVAAALYGEAGLGVHLSIVSLHALSILVVTTALVETDLARERARAGAGDHGFGRRLWATARHTVIHPVVLPVVLGLAVSALGWRLPAVIDDTFKLLGDAAVPVCLVVLGLSLAEQGREALRAAIGPAVSLGALKLLVLPLAVLAAGLGLAGLHGVPLAVVVMCAALPTGSNALIFAQRYGALTGETSVVTAVTTLVYALTAPLWVLLLARWA